MGIGKNNSPQNPMTKKRKIEQPVSQVQGGAGTTPTQGKVVSAQNPTLSSSTSNSNPSSTVLSTFGNKDLKYNGNGMTTSDSNNLASPSVGSVPIINGSVATANNPSLTNPSSVNSQPNSAINPTYGNKDNRLSSVGSPTSSPLTTVGANSQNVQQVEDSNIVQPTLQDFISEAQKLGQEEVMASIDPNFANDLARQLYGQNVGMSGLGTNVVSNALDKTLAPIAKQVSTKLGQQALDQQFDKIQQQADKLFSLVQSGQLTGKQAEQSLIDQGINPQDYMTPDAYIAKQEQEELDKYLEQIDDPIERELIDSVEEFQHYMEFGRTYEDELSDILTTKKSLREWEAIMPTLRQHISIANDVIRREQSKGSGLFGFGGADKHKIAMMQSKLNAVKEIMADIESGKNPIYDIAKYGG